MDYKKHYNLLINRAKGRTLEGYSEKHHIIPKCMGGSDSKDNLVRLTAEEHYVAHQLLVKMYPDNDSLVYALRRMSGGKSNRKAYGWIKKTVVQMLSRRYTGRPLSEKQVAGNLSRRGSKANENQLKGLESGRIKEAREKAGKSISLAKKGKPQSEAHKAALSKVRKGRVLSDETKLKMSKSKLGKMKSEETRKRMSAARKGVSQDNSYRLTDEYKVIHSERMKKAWAIRKSKINNEEI